MNAVDAAGELNLAGWLTARRYGVPARDGLRGDPARRQAGDWRGRLRRGAVSTYALICRRSRDRYGAELAAAARGGPAPPRAGPGPVAPAAPADGGRRAAAAVPGRAAGPLRRRRAVAPHADAPRPARSGSSLRRAGPTVSRLARRATTGGTTRAIETSRRSVAATARLLHRDGRPCGADCLYDRRHRRADRAGHDCWQDAGEYGEAWAAAGVPLTYADPDEKGPVRLDRWYDHVRPVRAGAPRWPPPYDGICPLRTVRSR